MIDENEPIKLAEIEQLKARLLPIAERDRASVAIFASRCALRAFPFLACPSSSDFSPEDQALHLLAVWFAVLSAISRVDVSIVRAAHNAAIYVDTNAYYTVRAVTAVRAAVDAYDFIPNDIQVLVAQAATLAAESIFFLSPSTATFDIDLNIMERGEKLPVSTPLFNRHENDSVQLYLNDLNKLISQVLGVEVSNSSAIANLIGAIPKIYGRFIEGSFALNEADNSVRAMYDYFKAIEKRDSGSSVPDQENYHEQSIEAVAEKEEGVEKSSSINHPIFEFEPTRQQSPEATSKEDHLNRLQLVNALAAILADPANDQHQTLGLLGEWGSGKSTWLGFLETALLTNHSKQPFIFGNFNAWAYEHTENLQAGIAHEMIKALVAAPSGKNWFAKWWWGWKLKCYVAVALHGWPRMLRLFFKFIAAIVPLPLFAVIVVPEWVPNWIPTWLADLCAKITAAIGYTNAAEVGTAQAADKLNTSFFDKLLPLGTGVFATLVLIKKTCLEQWKAIWASPEAKELLTYLKLPDYAKHLGEIPVMRKTLEKFCTVRLKNFDNKTSRLLFVVDDLDRCSHQGIVKVFEAVRLVLDIPNVTVIIAVDQHIALAALALHYKELAEHHKLGNARAIARDYLAKVIHLPIILSRPNSVDVKNYLEKIWEKTAPQTQPQIPPPPLPFSTPSPASSSPQPAAGNPPAAESQTPVETPAEPNSSQMTSASAAVANADTPEPVAPPTLLKGLTFGQKNAFAYWAAYFELTNPRQLKRLNNTYGLLLNAFPSWDKKSAKLEFGGSSEKIFYPILIALVTLEYLNALEDPGLRRQLKAKLAAKDTEGAGHVLISADFLRLFAELGRDANVPLLSTLEPFVLPAIECEKEADAARAVQR